ncbi:TIGR02678 family protein [Nocardiopsis gilva YIM 90087]|uniref:TIGR02678 family protein n=1 Tax=Nocardiopsis gilva YIM 90087 TaxID=1235441 RepID=A0A223SDG9_9ACTN|nr:TIGR02678 family protein [Nocardiopsis gilva YIM 90087]
MGSPEKAAFGGLDAIEAAQVRRCARVLLRRPLLRADGPDGDALPAMRRYADRLQALFAGYLGYRLVIEPTFARLYKTGRTPDGVRGAHKHNGAPFTPRGYAYLALVLAALTGGGRQLLLSGLVADVRAAGTEAGLDLGTGIVDRRALAAALRLLIDLGVLTETDGSVAPWADDASREALLTVDLELLGHLVAAPLGRFPSAEALSRSAGAGAEERHRVRRRLVEDPVVLASGLAPEQWDWLRTNLRSEAHLLEELLGLRLEVRSQGVLAVDPEGYLTDRVFPGTGTIARIALLAAAELLADGSSDAADGADTAAAPCEADGEEGAAPAPDGSAATDGGPWTTVSLDRLGTVVAGLVERYPQAWSKDAVRDTRRLARSVADTLAQSGLARRSPGGLVQISPAAARYRPVPDGPPGTDAPGDGDSPDPAPAADDAQDSLFSL